MKNKSAYQYSEIDALEFPQTYQYSSFEGMDFLKSYKDCRNKAIKFLKSKGKSKPFEGEQYESANVIENLEVINTNKAMHTIFSSLKSGISDEIIYRLLSRFLKKYEVSKKIYVSYDKDFKRISDDFNNLENYVLLSYNLLLYYKKTLNLKFLNTSLKINDMLCSKITKLNSLLDCQMLNNVLNMELNVINTLFESKGVKI